MSVERQLPKKTTLAVTYTNSHGLHELRSRNINAPLPDGVYPYPTEGPIYEMESAGLYNQKPAGDDDQLASDAEDFP